MLRKHAILTQFQFRFRFPLLTFLHMVSSRIIFGSGSAPVRLWFGSGSAPVRLQFCSGSAPVWLRFSSGSGSGSGSCSGSSSGSGSSFGFSSLHNFKKILKIKFLSIVFLLKLDGNRLILTWNSLICSLTLIHVKTT